MKNLIASVIVALALSLALPVAAQDFDKGHKTLESGYLATALRELKLLGDQGKAGAQFYLSFMYNSGDGGAQDYVEAAKWYRLAAKQGVALAQHDFSIMHFQGQGVPRFDVLSSSRLQ